MLNMCGQIAVYVLTVSHYIDNLPCPLDKLRSDFSGHPAQLVHTSTSSLFHSRSWAVSTGDDGGLRGI